MFHSFAQLLIFFLFPKPNFFLKKFLAFNSASAFNGDISKWATSSVKTTSHMFTGSGFTRTLCGSIWVPSGARAGCCSPGTYMSNPNLSPFSQENSCNATCPAGQYGPPTIEDDDPFSGTDALSTLRSQCKFCPAGKWSTKTGLAIDNDCTSCQEGH